DRALRDHPDLPGARERKRELDRFLVRDADRRLQRIETAALDGEARRRAVAAVADVACEAPCARLLERVDDVASLELGERTAVELHQIEMVGPETLEASLDALHERLWAPVRAPAGAVPALGEEMELASPGGDRLADQELAVVVALGGVDDVQAGVER